MVWYLKKKPYSICEFFLFSSVPVLELDPDPAIFVTDLQDAIKK
jgi:hypothetical protein